MKVLKNHWLQMALRQKLIVAFACFIVIPYIIIGGTLSWLFVQSNKRMILDATLANNRQIAQNIDTSLSPLLRFTMVPVQNKALFQLMRKDYEAAAFPLLERSQAFDEVGDLIRNSIMLYTDLIDSAVIYQSKNNMILGRSNNDYMNHAYLEHEFYHEPFVQSILSQHGNYVSVGIHEERLLSIKPTPVVSIGRAVVDPFSKEKLGFILFNINAENLKSLWSDIQFTKHARYYLVDQNANIIYSKDGGDIGKSAEAVLGKSFQAIAGGKEQLYQDKQNYAIKATSSLSGWSAVTVIPKHELFGFVDTILRTIAISLFVLLGLSIAASIYIATGVTKPLRRLERQMKLVSQGELDISIDIQHGEFGKIGVTINRMLQDIRRMIRTIYTEEQEKRRLETLALQSQIRPHFMYNTLNAIKWMANMQGASGIEEALTAFSSVIQFTARTQLDFVSVREEIQFIRDYAKILDFRYLGKFELTLDIDEGVWEYQILKFLLQPLVENAIFHGFDAIPYKGKLEIRVHEEEGNIRITVTDNGRGMSPQQLGSMNDSRQVDDNLNAIGISNIRKRIELHFGTSYGLTITSAENAGTAASLLVPVIKPAFKGDSR
ncbi:sensor histidine kinase [Paenibacillus rhizovicinus]|uniref:histidine kinase n=1 Tax=Paenibacillus rhizovicinus TaxID=2704463 RepID=A0A6C0P529_9BACL|nr:sensor histidine kinase [Paenibacillus rhizovicinus]QHW33567.1 sensor histidine kinase [Paenibacillus rhizovicinus]